MFNSHLINPTKQNLEHIYSSFFLYVYVLVDGENVEFIVFAMDSSEASENHTQYLLILYNRVYNHADGKEGLELSIDE